jgi:hypothetical protein
LELEQSLYGEHGVRGESSACRRVTDASYWPSFIEQFGKEMVEVMRAILLVAPLFASLCLTSTSAHGQSKASHPEIVSLVRQLSWNSVGGACNGYWRVFPAGPAAERLIEIGKPATLELVQVLNDEERAVAAHLILTAIWEVKRIYFMDRVEGDEVEVAYFNHLYNGLRWTDVINWKDMNVSYMVNPLDLARNSQRWRRKLATKDIRLRVQHALARHSIEECWRSKAFRVGTRLSHG